MAVNEFENLLRESNTEEDILNNVQCCLDTADFLCIWTENTDIFFKYHIAQKKVRGLEQREKLMTNFIFG